MTDQIQVMQNRITDSNGAVVPGASVLYEKKSGTNTPVLVYYNAAGSIPASNPVVADAGGRLRQVFYFGADQVRATIKRRNWRDN
ncbi:MAG: hypothetical protein U5K75_12110 [Ahrensia sp.]|nr:hypothetical protein [Ahrensia sp.]